MHSRNDKPRNVRYIRHKIRAHFVRNLAETLVVDLSRIRACSSDNQLRFAFESDATHFVVVDEFGVGVYAVADAIEQFSAHIHFCAVREMSAVRKSHSQNGVAAFQKSVIRGEVGV